MYLINYSVNKKFAICFVTSTCGRILLFAVWKVLGNITYKKIFNFRLGFRFTTTKHKFQNVSLINTEMDQGHVKRMLSCFYKLYYVWKHEYKFCEVVFWCIKNLSINVSTNWKLLRRSKEKMRTGWVTYLKLYHTWLRDGRYNVDWLNGKPNK